MYKVFNERTSLTTPKVEVSEGIRPAQAYQVAPYLPLLDYSNIARGYKTIRHGKVIALDASNYIVPAGLLIDIETAIADGDFDGCVNVYSAADVANGIKNYAGAAATALEPVVQSMFVDEDATKGLKAAVSISKPIGIMGMDAWEQNGAGYGMNPVDYKYTNYNLQESVGVLTKYYIELPVVARQENAMATPLPGIACFIGNPKPGDLVTYDATSNFTVFSGYATPTAITADGDGLIDPLDIDALAAEILTSVSAQNGRILGRVLFVDTDFPKDYIDRVKTYNVGTHAAVGSATNGLPDNLWLAGVQSAASAKVVRVNITI